MNKLLDTKFKRIICLAAVIAAIFFVVAGTYEFYLFQNPLSRQDLSFQLYKPTRTLNGINLSNEQIVASMPSPMRGFHLFFWWKPRYITFNIGTYSEINEFKNQPTHQGFSCVGAKDTNANNLCAVRTTPGGIQYEYFAWYNTVPGEDATELDLETLSFVKGNTFITVNDGAHKNKLTSQSTMEDFIDSFKEIGPNGIPVAHGYVNDAP
ncbi:MAG TPA: hypothetical protein VNG90_02630 [Candidatus Acidoferrum sp.]|nr:hypothetical protein [Candidatus Acidoferrum sp.]